MQKQGRRRVSWMVAMALWTGAMATGCSVNDGGIERPDESPMWVVPADGVVTQQTGGVVNWEIYPDADQYAVLGLDVNGAIITDTRINLSDTMIPQEVESVVPADGTVKFTEEGEITENTIADELAKRVAANALMILENAGGGLDDEGVKFDKKDTSNCSGSKKKHCQCIADCIDVKKDIKADCGKGNYPKNCGKFCRTHNDSLKQYGCNSANGADNGKYSSETDGADNSKKKKKKKSSDGSKAYKSESFTLKGCEPWHVTPAIWADAGCAVKGVWNWIVCFGQDPLTCAKKHKTKKDKCTSFTKHNYSCN